MNARSLVARAWRRLRRRAPVAQGGAMFGADDIAGVHRLYLESGSAGSAWDPWRHAHMRLPDWFQTDLDPWGAAYKAQQLRLWQLVCGLTDAYDPHRHEKEVSWGDIDPVRQPGYYVRRDPAVVETASDHWIATGMLLKHCGLKPGDRAIEYGAGFGQSALALARLGVHVDTVDISATFCDFIRQQADYFSVPLTPHEGEFGLHPRPGELYQLIWFYESFHHCLAFQEVVPALAAMLAPGGRIILGGEPIVEKAYAAVPYPWGIRLHSEVVAVMRQTGWCELGFTEDFLYALFARSGLVGRRVDNDASLFGRLYIFERTPA